MDKGNQHKKIHVMFVLPSLLSGGGIEMHTLKLLRHFNREQFILSLVTLFERPQLPSLYKDVPQDVAIHRLNFAGASDIGQWRALYTLFKTLHPDAVVSSMFSANAIVRILKLFFAYKVITREHNTYEEKKIYHRIIDFILAPFSDVLVAVSSSVADFISKQAWISREKITVIHNGVDIGAVERFLIGEEQEKRRVRSEIGLLEDEKIILNIARLKPQKNHTLLVDAFVIFTQTHPKYHLVIVGDGVERERLGQYIRERGLQSTVHLLGYRDDVFAWYAASDFFVLTSKREGFPNVGIEAMTFGLPMVSTQVPGVDEFLRDGYNGYIAEQNPNEVEKKMSLCVKLLEQNHAQIQKNCHETALRFDIVQVTKEYEKSIQSIL
ncbi:MAG: glycosyltransferase [Candidatus Campbellbacteria bacterium]|nr:glycosyltransferase [Candidatus Campbellbacteria bacterium]